MIRAVLFDLDGVLIDFADAHFRALNRALAEVESPLAVVADSERERFEALPTREKLRMMVDQQRISAAHIEAVYRRKQELTLALAEEYVAPVPERVEMVRSLADRYLVGCVSNCVGATVHQLMDLAGYSPYLSVTISNEDVPRPKPAPDPYLYACFRLKMASTSEALAIEDHERGLASARQAGCACLQLQYDEVNLGRIEAELCRLTDGI